MSSSTCCIAAGASIQKALRALSRPGLYGAAALITAGGLGAVLNAAVPGDAAQHFISTLLELVFALMLWDAFRGPWRDFRRQCLICVAAGIGLHVVIGYALILSVRDPVSFDWVKLNAGGTNVRHLGYYATPLCGLAAGLFATTRDRRARALYLVLLTLGFWWNDLSGGRGSFGAGIVGGIFVWLLSDRSQRRSTGIAIIIAFALALPLSLTWVPPDPNWGIRSILGRSLGYNLGSDYTSGRSILWRAAIRGILRHPLIGNGEQQFIFAPTPVRFNHPHDLVLQFLYAWGFIGTAGLVAMLAPTVLRLSQALRQQPSVSLPAIGAISGEFALSLIDGPLCYVFPVMVMIVCFAVLASAVSKPQSA